jgi:hypothetical protein
MQKLVWRLKLEADLGGGAVTEVEIGRIEREAWATPEALGLSLAEVKRLSAALQTEMVQAQAAIMGVRFRCCGHCESDLSSKGYARIRHGRRSAVCEPTLPPRLLIRRKGSGKLRVRLTNATEPEGANEEDDEGGCRCQICRY